MSFYLIEKTEQLNRLDNLNDCFVSFIPYNNNFHPKLNGLSLIYVRDLEYHKGYILCIKHSETLSLSTEQCFDFLRNKTNKVFVINKKESLYHFNYPEKLFDISFIQIPDLSKISIRCINDFYNRFQNYEETNCLIPVSKHYEEQELIFDIVKPIVQKYNETDGYYKFKNELTTDSFFYIENQGIKLHKENYIKYFSGINFPEYNINYGKIFTQYNLYTTTGRPSNHFNNINFAGLNKDNGERSILIPENDELVELDISAYHPRIIADLINYELPKSNVYEELKIEKEEMFKNIYGGIKHNHPFLLKIKDYILTTFKGNQKQFNHEIQKLETDNNVKIIQNIKEYLKAKKSKLILYTYDAFLFDISFKDKKIVSDLQNIIKYPTKIKKGSNYHVVN